jgi:hypothetical protein
MTIRRRLCAVCLVCAAIEASPAESAPWSALFRAGKKADTAADAARASSKAQAALTAGRVANRAAKASTTREDRGATELPAPRPNIAVKGDGLSRAYGVAGAAMLLMAAYLFLTGRQSKR